MKIKSFNKFVNEDFSNFFKNTNLDLVRKNIEKWCDDHFIKNYVILEDDKYGYIINVGGDVFLVNKNLDEIPYKFGIVSGSFKCSFNNLKSLKNTPDECIEFDCSYNKNLKTLNDGPKRCKFYYCNDCNLISLEGAPEECEIFKCYNNKNLKSLEGGPKKVLTEYDCSTCNNLISLEGAPEEVKKFNCSGNYNLKNLIGGPKKAKEYDCSNCGLYSLEGAPEECEIFIYSNNPKRFTREKIKQYIKNVKKIII